LHDDVTPKDAYELAARHVVKFLTQATAFEFWARLEREDKECGPFNQLKNSYPDLLENMMSLSRDELILGVSMIEGQGRKTLLERKQAKIQGYARKTQKNGREIFGHSRTV
jgi:hypothetical protein